MLCLTFPIAVASGGYSSSQCTGFSLQWFLLLGSMGSRAWGLRELPLPGSRAQAQLLYTGWVASRHVGSSLTRDGTRVSCTGRQILYHWAATEALSAFLHNPSYQFRVPDLFTVSSWLQHKWPPTLRDHSTSCDPLKILSNPKKKKFLIVKPLMPLCLPFAQQMTIPPASQKSIKWEFPLFLLPSVNAASACSFPVHSFSPKQPFHLSWPSPWSLLFLKNSASPLIAQMVKNLPAMQETQVPWRKMPWRRTQQPTPVFLPGDSHGQSSLAGYRPWGHKSWTWLSDFHILTRIFIQPMPNPITVHERNFLLILLSLQPPPLLSLLFHSETSRNELPKLIVSISLHLSLLCCFRISASLKITMTSWPLWFEAKHC